MTASRSPTMAEVLRDAIAARLLDAHTLLPAQVTRVDAALGQVDVKPLVRAPHSSEVGDLVFDSLPVVTNCPIAFLGAGGFVLTVPVAVGDLGCLFFAEASLDAWLGANPGTDVDPKDPRRLALSDGVFLPGLRPFSSPWKNGNSPNASFGQEGGTKVEITPAGNIVLAGGTANAVGIGQACSFLLTSPSGPVTGSINVGVGASPGGPFTGGNPKVKV